MAADGMSSEQQILALHLAKLIVIWINLKYQLALKYLPNKTRLIGMFLPFTSCFHNPKPTITK